MRHSPDAESDEELQRREEEDRKQQRKLARAARKVKRAERKARKLKVCQGVLSINSGPLYFGVKLVINIHRSWVSILLTNMQRAEQEEENPEEQDPDDLEAEVSEH